MSDCPIGIDYIVSFSVFEHVFDRVGYLAECSRVLAGDGRIFLNYDDGHFRFNFAINQGVPILQNLMQGREVISNLIRPVAARAWLVRFYQARVTEAIIDKLVRRADLRIVSKRFANLVSMKRLAKMIEANSVEAFHETWLRLEDELNHAVTFCPSSAMGHKDARWLEMPSCTLILGKK